MKADINKMMCIEDRARMEKRPLEIKSRLAAVDFPYSRSFSLHTRRTKKNEIACSLLEK